jgi:hypothetical protein
VNNETTFDASMLATAWLSVALASGRDPDVPVLNRTILVEQFPQGLRFVATDRYVLLRAFAPNIDHKPTDEPGIDEAPDEFAVAMDLDGRAKGLLGYLLGLARHAAKEGLPTVEVGVTLNATDEADEPTLAGLERRYVRFDYQAQERLQLDTYGGDFPEWRGFIANLATVSTEAVALNPEIVGRLAKLGKLHGNAPILWRFGGEDKAAAIEVMDSEPHVRGVVMPVRLAPEDLA